MKPRRNSVRLRHHAALATAVLCMSSVHAASLTWDGNGATAPNPNGGAGTWDVNTTANWWDGSANVTWPAAGGTDDDAVFANTAGTVSLAAGGVTANEVSFTTTGYVLQGNTLTLNGISPTLGNNSGVTSTIHSVVAGTGVTKSGAGTLVLGGNNTALNGITLSQGTLQSGAMGSLGTGVVTMGDANSGSNPILLLYTAGNTSATNVTVSSNGTGDAIIKWTEDVWGSSGQAYNTASSMVWTLGRMTTFQSGNSTKQISGKITGGVTPGNVAVKVNGGTQVIISAGANASNTALVQNDYTGNVWVTGNTTFYSINRTYHNGTFFNAVVPDQATVIIDSGSTWQHTWGDETIGFLSGTGTVNYANNGNTTILTLAGSSGTATTGGQTGTATFSGPINNLTTKLVKNGTGTQEFSGTFTMNGKPVDLNDGTLKLTNISSSFASTGAINVGASNSPVLQLNASGSGDSWTVGKAITGGSANAKLEKTGPGTVTLTQAVTFSGPTRVSAGVLRVNGSLPSGSATTVVSGGTLAGTGTVAGTVTVEAGGMVAPGGASLGTLSTGATTVDGAYHCRVDGAATDVLAVTGNLTFGAGVTITFSEVNEPTADSYVIATYTGALTGTPTAAGLPDGYVLDTATAGQIKLVSNDPYTVWASAFPGLTDSEPDGDPDHDGVVNLIEFLTDGDPTVGSQANLPVASATEISLVFTFILRDDAAYLAPTVEFSTSLESGSWTTAVDGANSTIESVDNGGGTHTVTVTIPKDDRTRLFARLRVTDEP